MASQTTTGPAPTSTTTDATPETPSHYTVWHNPKAAAWTTPSTPSARYFHEALPNYSPTLLHPLPSLATTLGARHVFAKDESSRLGLPSFKILGASWGAVRAVASFLSLDPSTPLDLLSSRAQDSGMTLYAATDGNHGRALARTATLLHVACVIFVPRGMHAATEALISSEGATIVQTDASYDTAVSRAHAAASSDPAGILVQDTAFEGYEEVPRWIVQGYGTLLEEIDEALASMQPPLRVTHVAVPVGVGSFAHAVVAHYKSVANARVIAVEPEGAACLHESLHAGEMRSVDTRGTIMAGMECGTVSRTAWPVLREGVDASVVVSDQEAHRACQELHAAGIRVGPCGAATVAAMERLTGDDRAALHLDAHAVVVLLCTEGEREYVVPV